MILSDSDIRREVKNKHIIISPFNSKSVQPASYDIRLGRKVRIFKNIHKPFLDTKNQNVEEVMELINIKDGNPFIVHPGEFVLGTSVERITVPPDIICRLDGKSSLGRLGIIVHATAGYIDLGFSGDITLEITNLSNIPIALYPGTRVGQISFMRLENPAKVPYGEERGSKYQGQCGPTASRIWKDFKPNRKKGRKKRKNKYSPAPISSIS